MLIGIDGSRAFMARRTGIEEYSYQVIKNLTDKLSDHRVILYITNYEINEIRNTNWIPKSWEIKIIHWPRFWTQIGLSLEMFFHPVDTLFIPAHTIPIIHPARNASLFYLALAIQKLLKIFGIKTGYNSHSDAGGSKNTIVTIHGLEYEILPEAYSFWERIYMRWSIKNSCRWASRIIAVSENTKKDLMEIYGIASNKIVVIYEGVNVCHSERSEESRSSNDMSNSTGSFANAQDDSKKQLLFIGRLEERKNIVGIIRAFEILKEKYKIPHKLVLAGKFGYGAEKIRKELKNINYTSEIILTGWVSEEEKWNLLKNADVFLFPTFYEGFGLPILEAQSVGTPVVAGDNSSIREITNPKAQPSEFLRLSLRVESALLVNPNNAEAIADATYKIISDEKLKNSLIQKGYENTKRFSWNKCAEEIAEILTED